MLYILLLGRPRMTVQIHRDRGVRVRFGPRFRLLFLADDIPFLVRRRPQWDVLDQDQGEQANTAEHGHSNPDLAQTLEERILHCRLQRRGQGGNERDNCIGDVRGGNGREGAEDGGGDSCLKAIL